MVKIRSLIVFFIKLVCASVVSILLLSGFVLLYSNTGVHIDNKDGSTDYKWLPDQFKTTMTEGFAVIKTDGNGFNNVLGDVRNINVLLMGSSHMEAFNIPQDKNTAAVLNTLIDPLYCYNIGISGHSLYTCMKNVQRALEVWQPSDYVVIVSDTAEPSEDDMRSVLNGTYEKIPSYDQGLLFAVQKYVPGIKVIYKDIEDWYKADEKEENGDSDPLAEAFDVIDTCNDEKDVLSAFLGLLKNAADQAGVTPILVFQPPTEIDSNGQFICKDEFSRTVLAQACESAGIVFVDMTQAFQRLYEERHILAHGFANTAVGVGHLNAEGHRLIAEKLAEVILGHVS